MDIHSPYASKKPEIREECGLSQIDVVERSGYVPPDLKVKTFIESGQLLQNIRTGGEEFDLQGGETDNDPDSPEYLQELHEDAENYEGDPLPQYIDKISAVEKLDEVDKTLTVSEAEHKRETKSRKSEAEKTKKYIDDFSTSLAAKIKENEMKIENE